MNDIGYQLGHSTALSIDPYHYPVACNDFLNYLSIAFWNFNSHPTTPIRYSIS